MGGETIKDVIPDPEPVYEKRPIYVSRHMKKIEEELKGKYAHQTFGVPNVKLRAPSQFLKKKSRVDYRRTDVKHVHYKRPGYCDKLPAWTPLKKSSKPKIPALPTDPVSTGRINFRERNVLDVKAARPAEPKKRYVDTRIGETHDLPSSGLYPIYIYKKNFGKAPKFIVRERKQLLAAAEKEKIEHDTKDIKDVCKCGLEEVAKDKIVVKPEKKFPFHYVGEEERTELLDGMKKKWEELMQEFQRLPFLTDTAPKILRKTKMERDLLNLEKDIDLIKRHKYIYVYDD